MSTLEAAGSSLNVTNKPYHFLLVGLIKDDREDWRPLWAEAASQVAMGHTTGWYYLELAIFYANGHANWEASWNRMESQRTILGLFYAAPEACQRPRQVAEEPSGTPDCHVIQISQNGSPKICVTMGICLIKLTSTYTLLKNPLIYIIVEYSKEFYTLINTTVTTNYCSFMYIQYICWFS